MKNVAFAAFDRFCTKIGVGSSEDNHKILWEFFRDWDYAQTNDRLIWDNDPHADSLIEADALIKANVDAGFRKFFSLAEAGSVWAMLKVGHCYYRGRGVTRSTERAEYWYGRSYEAGCTRALLDLGSVLAAEGKLEAAEAVYRRGAVDDWGPALFWLARYSVKRSDTPKARSSARLLLERAAAKGSPAAIFTLALDMARGRFGVLSMPQGFRLLWTTSGKRFEEIEKRRTARERPKTVVAEP